jgi:hypothetical protein
VAWLTGAPVTPKSLPRHPELGSRVPDSLLLCRPSRPHAFHESSAPSAGRSHRPLPSLALGARLPGRHWYPGFAAKGPASDMLLRSASPNARHKHWAGFHRSAWATCRPPTSAAECSSSTPPSCPNSSRDSQRQAAARLDDSAPCGARPTELLQARGRSDFLSPFDPQHDDRSPRWIYPNLTDSDTSCHEPVSSNV